LFKTTQQFVLLHWLGSLEVVWQSWRSIWYETWHHLFSLGRVGWMGHPLYNKNSKILPAPNMKTI